MLATTIILAFTSVGIVIGGNGQLVVDKETLLLRPDGWYIKGWWQWDWFTVGAKDLVNGAPTWNHPFGQDDIGRDIFARVMRGMQQSLLVTFIVGFLSTAIGVVLGSLAGYYRKWTDSVIMRIADIILIVPVLVLGAVLGRSVGGGALFLAIMLGLVAWPGLARLVRGEFLSLREREFVDAAVVSGASARHIIFKHILPNSIGVIVVNTTLLMSAAILIETSLSFLGFGITPPDVSLGQIINEYQTAFQTRPWLFWYPGLFIILIALCINFIGDGLRDAFDPRQRRDDFTKEGFFKSLFGGKKIEADHDQVVVGTTQRENI